LAQHDYLVSRLFMDLVNGYRAEKQGLVMWANTYQSTSFYTDENNRPLLIPDATGRFVFQEGELAFHVELEKRNFSIQSMKNKIVAYNKVFRRFATKDPLVLVISAPERVARVQKAILAAPPSFNILIGVTEVNPLLPLVWVDKNNKRVSLKDFCQFPRKERAESEFIRPGGGFNQ